MRFSLAASFITRFYFIISDILLHLFVVVLKKKSEAAGLSANAWLMAQLETNRPFLHWEEETWEVIRFMDEAGREINEIAHDFNSDHGTAEQLRHAVRLLRDVYERIYVLRKKGYLYAA